MVKKSTWFSRTFFDVILLVEKSTLFPRTFFDVISMVKKSTLFPRTVISVILMVEICTLFLLTFFDVILMGKDLTSFLVSCKLMKTFENFFPVFVTLNSWLLQDCSLSSKSPWCSLVPLKFESYNLHQCKKNCCKLVFLVFTEQLHKKIIFGQLYCYEITLIKKCNKPLLQKSETVFNQKQIYKKTCWKSARKIIWTFRE